ncbi:MAG: hypothetical protein OER56_01055 [Hyphomicrobiales bacterium]|nr:hypothetical protein [Hyphomicrobiales bacterium]
MTSNTDTTDQKRQTGPIIDSSVIDALFEQLDVQVVHDLIENCFTEFDQQIENFKQAGARGDWAGCLTTLHGLRGIAVDYGAAALSDEITATKQILLSRRYDALADQIRNLSVAQRDARTALMMRLAKCAATKQSNGVTD